METDALGNHASILKTQNIPLSKSHPLLHVSPKPNNLTWYYKIRYALFHGMIRHTNLEMNGPNFNWLAIMASSYNTNWTTLWPFKYLSIFPQWIDLFSCIHFLTGWRSLAAFFLPLSLMFQKSSIFGSNFSQVIMYASCVIELYLICYLSVTNYSYFSYFWMHKELKGSCHKPYLSGENNKLCECVCIGFYLNRFFRWQWTQCPLK